MSKAAILSRNFSQLNKTMFHGTSSKHYDSLIKGVDLSACKKSTDFGRGFYLTTSFLQASKHAQNRTFRGNESIVFEYVINLGKLKTYNPKFFHQMNHDWAKFIYHNRSKTNFMTHNYDYVFGGVADGLMEDLIEEMDSGPISDTIIDYFYNEIAKYATYDQLSIHKQEIFNKEIISLNNIFTAFQKSKEYTE